MHSKIMFQKFVVIYDSTIALTYVQYYTSEIDQNLSDHLWKNIKKKLIDFELRNYNEGK